MQITQHLHTTVLVSNLKKAEYFYGNILGLSKVKRQLNFPGAWYQIGDFQIHLIVDESLKLPLQNAEKWGRNPHIALAVTDLNTAENILLAKGCVMQRSTSGRAALFTKDPDGNIIELTHLINNSSS